MENSHEQPFSYQHGEQPVPAAPKQHGQAASRSVAYVFSAITLLTVAVNLTIVLIAWANSAFTDNGISFDVIAFPAAALVVALPVFTGLLMDLERAELKNPRLKSSPYKKYSAQFVKFVALVTCFFTLIALVFGIFLHAAANSDGGWLPRLFTDVLIILAVAGGVLAFAIMSDHRKP